MLTFGLHKNTVFNWHGKTHKVERITPDDKMLLECIETGEFSIESRQQLLNEYKAGKIEASIDGVQNSALMKQIYSRPLSELPEKTLSQVKRRKQYLTGIYEYGTPIFTRDYLEPIILKVAVEINDKKPPNVTTVYRWHKKFCVTQETRSLIPRIDRRGRRGLKVDHRVISILVETIESLFRQSPQTTIKTIQGMLLGRVQEENKRLTPDEALKAPSRCTLYRMISKIEVFERISLKIGKQAAEKLFRLVKNKVVTTHILERIEVDHTPLDLFLIDENTHLPLGRPTVTIIIDHYSRMILGYYISYQNPSTAAVMGALRHAILPKTPIHQAIPSLKVEHQWACYGVPELMVLDNGLEFHSDALESVAFDLGINMQFCPKHEPRFKAVVERYLKTLNYSFASQIPGASFAKWHLRGDYDPQKHAILTLGEFTHLFEKWVLDIYSQTKHRGINTTPWAKWHEGLHSYELKLPMSVQDLQKRIGQVKTRSLSREGILIKGIQYINDKLGQILRAHGKGVKVRVMYDPQDLGEIQVWAPDSEAPITVEALSQAYARGLTEQQNQEIQAYLREQGNAAVNEERLIQARYDLSKTIEDLLNSRHLKSRKKGGRLSGISSTNPKGTLLESEDAKNQNAKQNVKTSRPKLKPQSKDQPYQLPALLSTFNLDTRRSAK
jgi:putative transposase